ncbi:MAG TPA: hypothetical protein VFQ37_05035 [Mycobacterium sp.]|nr:hypothetical protein [Mycobacterium sp.]
MRATALATGATVAGATIIGAAPVQRPSLPDAVPVVQVQDVTLTSFDFDSFVTFFVTSLEKAAVVVLRELSRLFGFSELTTSEWLDKFFLGNLTPNELLKFTGLGHMILGDLNHLAGIFGLNQNPISALLAVAGLSDSTTLPRWHQRRVAQ